VPASRPVPGAVDLTYSRPVLNIYSSQSCTENARSCRISRVSSTMSDGAGSKVGLEVMPITSVTLVTGTVRESARRPAQLFVRGGCLFISMIIHATPGVASYACPRPRAIGEGWLCTAREGALRSPPGERTSQRRASFSSRVTACARRADTVSQRGARPCRRCGGSAGRRSLGRADAMSTQARPGRRAAHRRSARSSA
jgi:hypothetical protein